MGRDSQVSKVWNQATSIITGVMKSMLIQQLVAVACLNPLEDCRDSKLQIQAVKFKRLKTIP